MAQLFANFAQSTLQQAILAADTTIFIDATEAAAFPSPGAGDFFLCAIWDQRDSGLLPEIVRVNARSGGELTVVRAQEATAARDWPAGSRILVSLTKATVESILNQSSVQTRWFGTATGSAAYTVTITGGVPTPNSGDEVIFIVPNTSTGPSTLTITNGSSSIGPNQLRKQDGTQVTTGELVAGYLATAVWNAAASAWYLVSSPSNQVNASTINSGPIADANQLSNGHFLRTRQASYGTPASGSETLDNVYPVYDGTIGSFSISQEVFTLGQTDVAGDPQFFLRWNQATAGSGSTFRGIRMKLQGNQGVLWRAEETVVLSFYGKADTNRNVTAALIQRFGTGGAPSPDVVEGTTVLGFTTSWQRFSIPVTLPSITGKTLGTNGDDHVRIVFDFPVNVTMAIDLAMVQLEPGGAASYPWASYPLPLQHGGTSFYADTIADLWTKWGISADAQLLLMDVDVPRIGTPNTWPGLQTFSASETLFSNANPSIRLFDTDGAADTRHFILGHNAGVVSLTVANDAFSIFTNFMRVTHTGTTVDEIELNATTFDFNGALDLSGAATIGGTTTLSGTLNPRAGINAQPTSLTYLSFTIDQTSVGGVHAQFASNNNVELDIRAVSNHPIRFWTNNLDRGGISAAGNWDILGTLELGHPSDNTLARIASGRVSIEGVEIATASNTLTLTNKTINLSSNTLSGTTAQFNAALSDGDFATLAGTETLTNKTLTAPRLTDQGPTQTDEIGYRGAPINEQNAAYTLVLADAGKTIFHDETTARTWTIPANASVAFPIGTVILLDNTGNAGGAPGAITLQITSDELRRGDGVAGTGSRTIPANATASIRKVDATRWVISGTFT